MDVNIIQPNQHPQEGLSDQQTQQVLDMIERIALVNRPAPVPEMSSKPKSAMEEFKETMQDVCAATFRDHQRREVQKKPTREKGQTNQDFWGDGMPVYDTRGRPRCYGRARYGHIRRDCRQRSTRPDVEQKQQSGNR